MAYISSLLLASVCTPVFSQWGSVTETGKTCVECEYGGETFSTCGKWGASYVWCCTAAPYSNSNWEKCDETTTPSWGAYDLESLGADPSDLAVCKGDCDDDAQCPGASACVQRTNGSPTVEGCNTGDSAESERADTDYCNNPSTWGAYELESLGADPSDLAVCKGDCDDDAQCPGASACVQRTNGSPTVQGCTTGDSGESERADTDYCNNPSTTWGSVALEWLGADPSELSVCQGDCDDDAQCPGASVCVDRTNGSPATVDGCSTGDSGSTDRADSDYCSNPSTTWGSVALEWLGADPSDLSVCQGDCDDDAQCPGASVCVDRTNGSPTAVTGCTTGDSGNTERADTDYCNNPGTATTATSWGSVTETGKTCVECEYGGETFSTCGKWGASYVWCCTAAPYSSSDWEECDETTTATGNGNGNEEDADTAFGACKFYSFLFTALISISTFDV